MPRATRFTESLESRIPAIARRIRNRMSQLNVTENELVRKCNGIDQQLLSGRESLRMSRERVAKILMNCKKAPEKSAARIISYQELQAFSHALNVSIEWLVGQHDNHDPVFWNVLAEPSRAEHILHLLAEYEEKAGEIVVWAEFLLCSLVTPAFMHAFHDAHFSELANVGLASEKKRVVEFFDRVGNLRRERLLGAKTNRRYNYTQLIFLSDLEKIASGTGEYRNITAEIRKSCLKNLAELITDDSLNINLIIVNDENVDHCKRALRDYESLAIFGSEFTLWSYHSGNVAWSEHSPIIERHRKLISNLQTNATNKQIRDTANFILELERSIK